MKSSTRQVTTVVFVVPPIHRLKQYHCVESAWCRLMVIRLTMEILICRATLSMSLSLLTPENEGK
ncbi:hypothetical protein O9993_16650 [Vibrio lentus]|nr:hypothetical protein [Vibrio lentus]